MLGSGFHARTMNRIGNANAGAYAHSAIILDDRHEGTPVRDIRYPVFEAATKKMEVLLADCDRSDAGRWLPGRHENRPRPDALYRGMGGNKVVILPMTGRQLRR
jgi:hypothetical protein